MRIALIAPIEETVPPRKYGGTEWIVYHIAHGMGLRGNQVDLYAPGDSPRSDTYNLIPTVPQSIRTVPRYAESHSRDAVKFTSLSETVKKVNSREYDIVHNHASWRYILFTPLLKQLPLTTHHGPLNIAHQTEVFAHYSHLPYVSISDNQRRDLPSLNFVSTVYNGVDLESFKFDESRKVGANAPMLFLARMSAEKGAISAARAAGSAHRKLIVAAKVDTVDKVYYELFRKSAMNQYVSFEGEIDHSHRLELLQSARCLIIPIQWEEPFGLMFVEAMACGTPVISYSRGSAPEIIADGTTGYLVNQSEEYNRGTWTVKKTGEDGLTEAIQRIYSLPEAEYYRMRAACRAHVEKRFSVETMVSAYDRVYKTLALKNNS